MSVDKTSIARLYGVVQTYDWGVKGSQSLVAAAHLANTRNTPSGSSPVLFDIDQDTPYAELWFGTHPDGCSLAAPIEPESPTALDEQREQNPEPLTDWLKRGEESGIGDCPYLFKVLSIAKPLSLQLHPDEEHARELHEARPDIYKDPFDKPEMAIALSNPFEALCGFRRLKNIIALAEAVPAFGELLQNPMGKIEDKEDEEKCLKVLMSNLYAMSQEKVVEKVDHILSSAIYSWTGGNSNDNLIDTVVKTVWGWFGQDQGVTNMTIKAHHLFRRLHEAFPYDRGCFAAFFLNYVKLKPGECIFLSPNTIHAYIQGSCLECMKSGNNVIRAGLTSKFQDVETLKKLVDYTSLSVPSAMVKTYDVTCKFTNSGVGGIVGKRSSLKAYIPPITDAFRAYLLRLTLATKAPELPFPPWSPMMVYVIRGRVRLNHTSNMHKDTTSSITLSTGSTLVVKEWKSIGIDNPSKSWGDADKQCFVEMMTVDANALLDGTTTEGEAVLLFVLPNVEPSRLKSGSSRSGPLANMIDGLKRAVSKSALGDRRVLQGSKKLEKTESQENSDKFIESSPETPQEPVSHILRKTKVTDFQSNDLNESRPGSEFDQPEAEATAPKPDFPLNVMDENNTLDGIPEPRGECAYHPNATSLENISPSSALTPIPIKNQKISPIAALGPVPMPTEARPPLETVLGDARIESPIIPTAELPNLTVPQSDSSVPAATVPNSIASKSRSVSIVPQSAITVSQSLGLGIAAQQTPAVPEPALISPQKRQQESFNYDEAINCHSPTPGANTSEKALPYIVNDSSGETSPYVAIEASGEDSLKTDNTLTASLMKSSPASIAMRKKDSAGKLSSGNPLTIIAPSLRANYESSSQKKPMSEVSAVAKRSPRAMARSTPQSDMSMISRRPLLSAAESPSSNVSKLLAGSFGLVRSIESESTRQVEVENENCANEDTVSYRTTSLPETEKQATSFENTKELSNRNCLMSDTMSVSTISESPYKID